AQVRGIRQLIVHEQYNNVTQKDDIALLKLDQPVECNNYVQLACVPDAWLRVSQLGTCYISGWGATTTRSGELTDVLQEAQVNLIDLHLCKSSRWYHGAIHSGDSGGPLVCKDKHSDYYWLFGVTNWGSGCSRARRPGVYTSTKDFYEWILFQMG
ncbi:ACRO protein, partial [Heliornis fulica]|nr:ACRO protein [Heliornis fulica]